MDQCTSQCQVIIGTQQCLLLPDQALKILITSSSESYTLSAKRKKRKKNNRNSNIFFRNI